MDLKGINEKTFWTSKMLTKTLSALFAKIEGFLWAVFYLCVLLVITIHVETDCSDLIDMIDIQSTDQYLLPS